MKKIIAIMLILAIHICGCGTAETAQLTESTDGTAEVTEQITEATEPSKESTVPSEATEPSTEATESSSEDSTEPSSEDPTDPEPDPYADIKYYPFPLLDMTVAEIEATYGELEWSYTMYGATPVVYSIPSLDMELMYIIDPSKHDDKNLPKDIKPDRLWCENADIYPGFSVGMTPDQIPNGIEWLYPGLANTGEGNYGYYAYYNVYEAGCYIRVTFAIPKHILEEYPPVYGFSSDQLDALQSWSDEFIYDLYDTEIKGIEICRGILSTESNG